SGVADNAALVGMDLGVNVDEISLGVDGSGAHILDDGVTTDKIADVNVTEPKLADGAVTNIKIADANITLDKLFPGTTDNNIIRWNGTIWEEANIATDFGEDVVSTDGSISGVADNAALVGMDLGVNVDEISLG